jgi:glycosyltransferase involved in cell wall biosynthesis
MDYRPNVDAALWFCDTILPLIRAQHADATFAVVGKNPHSRLQRLHDVPGVTLTGYAASVLPYLHGAQVAVLPLRMGSGTRLKLIEALAAGKPVVSTALGAAGYPVATCSAVRIADEPAAFARAVNHFLDTPSSPAQAAAARRFADQYDWRVVMPQFEEVYRDCFKSSDGTTGAA